MSDRLSKLPVPILIQILSILPINNAGSTTVLSKKWRYVWTKITALRITQTPSKLNRSYLFNTLIHCAKQLCWDNFHTIQFHISALQIDYKPKKLTQVIQDIISGQNVKVINLHLKDFNRINTDKDPGLPSILFKMESLERIELSNRFEMTLPKKGVSLPCLKKLGIHVRCSQLQILGDIVNSCPLLEHLSMHAFLQYPKSCMYLWSNSLKRLEVETKLESSEIEYSTPALRILSDAPMLKDIDFKGEGVISFGLF